VVTPLKTLMGFSVHLNVQFKFYNLPFNKRYDYFHLISGQDILVKKLDEFLMFFELNKQDFLKIEREANTKTLARVKYYHPISQTNLSRSRIG